MAPWASETGSSPMFRFNIFGLLILIQSLVSPALAQTCGSVLQGAQPGRPQNWAELVTEWPSGSTCWFQWREPGATKNRRDEMRQACLSATQSRGLYIHFQEDRATGHHTNTCIFRAPTSSEQQPTAPRRDDTAPESSPTLPQGPPARTDKFTPNDTGGIYGAIALAYADQPSKRVTYGVSRNFSTQAAADHAAIRWCEEGNIPGCKVVYRFWGGRCGYVAIAVQGGGNCAGYDSTPAGATQQCVKRGCKCQAPFGGCTRTK